MRLAATEGVRRLSHSSAVRSAGIVIGRQRPDTACGVRFVTLEDELAPGAFLQHCVFNAQRPSAAQSHCCNRRHAHFATATQLCVFIAQVLKPKMA